MVDGEGGATTSVRLCVSRCAQRHLRELQHDVKVRVRVKVDQPALDRVVVSLLPRETLARGGEITREVTVTNLGVIISDDG